MTRRSVRNHAPGIVAAFVAILPGLYSTWIENQHHTQAGYVGETAVQAITVAAVVKASQDSMRAEIAGLKKRLARVERGTKHQSVSGPDTIFAQPPKPKPSKGVWFFLTHLGWQDRR